MCLEILLPGTVIRIARDILVLPAGLTAQEPDFYSGEGPFSSPVARPSDGLRMLGVRRTGWPERHHAVPRKRSRFDAAVEIVFTRGSNERENALGQFRTI